VRLNNVSRYGRDLSEEDATRIALRLIAASAPSYKGTPELWESADARTGPSPLSSDAGGGAG